MQAVPIRVMPAHQRFEIRDPGEIPYASRCIGAIAALLGFSQTRIDHVSVIATECSTNLLLHANGGQLLVCPLMDSAGLHPSGARGAGIEILSIENSFHMSGATPIQLAAGRTAAIPEHGMSAIQRHADEFDIWSPPASGAVQRIAIWSGVPPEDPATSPVPDAVRVEYGAISVALRGQDVCGDAWTCTQGAEGFTAMVADGLGHGLLAQSAALAAIGSLAPDRGAALRDLVSGAHHALRPTVGAALGVARLPPRAISSGAGSMGGGFEPRRTNFSADRVARFCGIGNVAASVWEHARQQHLVSHAGVVGHTVRKTQEFEAAWSPDALLVMHSDGLNTRWDLARYPGLSVRHPSVIAAVLYRDHAREDDVTVFVARECSPSS
jgi:hypothetical protein